MSVTVIDNRGKYDALMKRIALLRSSAITVGIHGDDAARDDGASNVLIGAVHEFGSDKVPARPFLRPGVAAAAAEIGEEAAIGLKGLVAGTTTVARVMGRMGNAAVAGIIRRIDSNIAPALSPKTIEKRIRRTQKGRKALNTANKYTRLLSRGGYQYQRRKQPFGKGAWVQKKLTPSVVRKAQKAFARVQRLQAGRFTALVDTGQLKASIAYKAVTP